VVEITVYTDGACSGNPGKGGYGIVMMAGQHRKELAQSYKLTTNNRMELLAVIVALETIKVDKANITIYTDSRYVVDAVEKGWVYNWLRTNFKNKKNPDLWKRFLLIHKKHNVKLQWVKGHNGDKENERCDYLATHAAEFSKTLSDNYFENHVEQSETPKLEL
jgi:ribonuclease HI